MPTRVVTLKLTDREEDLVQWLLNRTQLDSVSQTIRFSLVQAAKQLGISDSELRQLTDVRRVHGARRSTKIASLVGRHNPRRSPVNRAV